jgi:S-adenosylmethionine hydrolase
VPVFLAESGERKADIATLSLMTPPLSFLSDFGYIDEFVGVVHGVIARIAPSVRIIDLTHGIARGDVHGGAMALTRAIQFMPDGVILAVVDPGVGTGRKAVAVRTPVGYFVGPDNGLLAPAVAMVGGADLAVSIENEAFILPSPGATFHGRDVFAPAAAVLASGEARIEDLGPLVAPEVLTPLLIPLSEPIGDSSIKATALWVDSFGNVQLNVGPQDLNELGLVVGDDVSVRREMMDYRITWGNTYGDADEGEAVIHVDSHGQIALAVRSGRADDDFGIAVGDGLVIGRPGGGNKLEITDARDG